MPTRSSAAGPSQRQLRIGELIRHALSEIFLRSDIQDPDLVGVVLTVSEVRVSPDARNATVFAIPLGGEEQDQVIDALNRNNRHLRGELARSVHLKYIPSLTFQLDDSFDESSRVEQMLRSPKVAQDLDGG